MTRERRNDFVAVGVALAVLVALLGVRNLLVPGPLERLRSSEQGGRITYEGSWYFPRGGPYILGFESPRGEAVLLLDGVPIARGAGEQLTRRVHRAGAHAVRLDAPEGARLLWHPPGRRGPPEYVPPSSLSPVPPDRATFGDRAGASPIDGTIAIVMVLVVAAAILFLCRRGLRRVDRRTAIALAAVFVPALLVRLFDLGAAGQTWDEDVNWSAGRNYVTNFLSLDFDQRSWRWNYEHPPVMKYVVGIGAQLADGYGPARALSAVMMAMACALMVPIGQRLFDLRVGIVGGIVCALTPHLVAHGKIVGHEAPSLLLWMILIWTSLRVHDPPHDDRWDPYRLPRRMALVGVVLGLAVFARFVNALAAPLVGAILLVRAPRGQRQATVLWGLAVIPAVALVTGLAIWPRMWSQPVVHLQEAWAKLKKPHSPEPYLGVVTNVPPRDYFLRYLVATAPIGILIAAGGWVVRALTRREIGSLILLFWMLAPLVVMLSPVRQDGVRYILPTVAAFGLAAAAGLGFVGDLVAERHPVAGRRVLAILAGAMTVYLAIACARVHPYYLDYYGEHVGGTAGVARSKSFEVAWWGEGIAEAIDVINERAAPGARVHKACVGPSHLTWLRGDLWASETRDPRRADWILVYQPSWRDCPVPPEAELVYEVTAAGAPLARVYRR